MLVPPSIEPIQCQCTNPAPIGKRPIIKKDSIGSGLAIASRKKWDTLPICQMTPASLEVLKVVEKVWFEYLERSLYTPICQMTPVSLEVLKVVEKV